MNAISIWNENIIVFTWAKRNGGGLKLWTPTNVLAVHALITPYPFTSTVIHILAPPPYPILFKGIQALLQHFVWSACIRSRKPQDTHAVRLQLAPSNNRPRTKQRVHPIHFFFFPSVYRTPNHGAPTFKASIRMRSQWLTCGSKHALGGEKANLYSSDSVPSPCLLYTSPSPRD